jgi:hypothetical protein
MRDERVVAARYERGNVSLVPRPENQVAVAKLHSSSLETTDGLAAAMADAFTSCTTVRSGNPR